MGCKCGVEVDMSNDDHDDDYFSSAGQNHPLSIAVLSWNIGTEVPPSGLGAIFEHKEFTADIVVVGLQEIVELKLKNCMINDNENDDRWNASIQETLNSGKDGKDKYTLLKRQDMVGIFMMIFVRNEVKGSVTGVAASTSATGVLSVVGDKGAVGMRFTVANTTMCFVCCHLAAHKNAVKERNDDYHEVHREIKFKVDDCKAILDHEIVFMFGDVNYRLDFPEEQLNDVYDLIKGEKWSELLAQDQLIKAIADNAAFEQFHEADIDFQPTYKFEPHTDDYDQEKKRMPAWCDRILWKSNNQAKDVSCLKYVSFMEQRVSDHKPVLGLYKAKI